MQIVTSWMEQGIEQGKAQGIEQGKALATQSLIVRLLQRQVGRMPGPLETQVKGLSLAELEKLGDALLGFEGVADLEQWLARIGQ